MVLLPQEEKPSTVIIIFFIGVKIGQKNIAGKKTLSLQIGDCGLRIRRRKSNYCRLQILDCRLREENLVFPP
jgi:hypothetical protein